MTGDRPPLRAQRSVAPANITHIGAGPGFTLTIDGQPEGKQRARTYRSKDGTVRTVTPTKTRLAEAEVRRAWENAGRPRVPDGPIVVRVLLAVARPRGHYRKDGTLNPEGQRHRAPHRQKPDVDNALKLCLDALNTRAWRDDVQVVCASVRRVWAEHPHTVIDVTAPDSEWIQKAA